MASHQITFMDAAGSVLATTATESLHDASELGHLGLAYNAEAVHVLIEEVEANGTLAKVMTIGPAHFGGAFPGEVVRHGV